MRKSAYMLKPGMKIFIGNTTQTVTAVQPTVERDRVIITCGGNSYRRPYGAKIEIFPS